MIPVHPAQLRAVLGSVLVGALLLAPLPIGVGIAYLIRLVAS